MVSPVETLATSKLLALGQSVWLDYISRAILDNGELARMVSEGWVTGLTSNPSIFEKAIAGSNDYDAELRTLAESGVSDPYEAFVGLAKDDIGRAADLLLPVYEASGWGDGFVSLEIPPGIEATVEGIVAEAKRLFALIGRPNLMVKVPSTPEGISALPTLIAAGVNVNMTLLFAVEVYEQVAAAYIAGLERRLEAGLPLGGVASVASFFVSRLDTAVDGQLPAGSPLRGKAAVGNARRAYGRFQQIFSGPRWEKLATAGAKVQRPLWASTGTKDPAYSDILYVEELVAPHTVNTLPEPTLRALLDHGNVRPTIVDGLAQSDRHLAELASVGIDLRAVTGKLLVDGLAAFDKDFRKMLDRIGAALATARIGETRASMGALAPVVDTRLAAMAKDDVVGRIWAIDHTVWKPDPAEITNRLGWLRVADEMRANVPALRDFATRAIADGFKHVLLLGMGGSSLAPEVMQATFGTARGFLDLHVLDTTDPVQIRETEAGLDLGKTLFIVASKSGGTIETMSQFAYFWSKQPEGRQYVAITDPGSSLERLARDHAFREVFLNPPEIGGRYSALSYFGLVPAALIGVDLDRLLGRANEMARACDAGVPVAENPGAVLGAMLGEAAVAGRDKLTLILPGELSTLGVWIEQLVAESTGKEGCGILPVEGEALGPALEYGNDRIFVAIGDHAGLDALEAAGHPVVRLPYNDPYQLGAEFFRWEFATAVACHVLGVNPFDQPNVQDAKDSSGRILAGEPVSAQPGPLSGVLASLKPGDYVAITAYLPRNKETADELAALREQLRARFKVAVTTGYGPRFLHSTGQLHKGGPNSAVVIQVVTEDREDLAIPGKPYTFGQLKAAQALGDLAALTSRGRRVARVTLSELRDGLRT